jgi:pyruvate,orthophosphate dikinase
MSPTPRPAASQKAAAKSAMRDRKASPRVYSFGGGRADGDRSQRDLLGGKGANLAEMSRLGLPIPPGFTITTETCAWFVGHGGEYPPGLRRDVAAALKQVESSLDKVFGDARNPLLVSVRSGARVSMPGMMDTVLNLGLNDETVRGLAERSGNARFAWDAYRRFVQMYGDVVLGVGPEAGEEEGPFALALEACKRKQRVQEDSGLSEEALRELVATYKAIVRRMTGRAFPEDPHEQLWGAISAVFESWDNERAIAYRAMNGIPGDWGTAVNVMAMVFGNMGPSSGTGVAFTRDPATGEKRFYGEYLMNAQGEDVVAGIRTPQPIATLEQHSPKAWRELLSIQKKLEDHFADMQDLEFSIEDGHLYMLQCRVGKRTGFAAVRIAVDLVREKRIDKEEALLRVEPNSLDQLLQPVFAPEELRAARKAGRALCKGLAAGPGAASGRIALTPARAIEFAAEGDPVILARIETSPEDIKGMQAAAGILTARGGMTSHAALVARQMGKVCVAGASALLIDYKKGTLAAGGSRLREGDWLSVDGTAGEVLEGRIATRPSEIVTALFGRGAKGARARGASSSELFQAYSTLMEWADATRRMGVRANADQPDQSLAAIALGAEGIGLCRTEHMFFGESKIDAVRRMILAGTAAERERALEHLLPLQRRDFEGIFKAMAGYPVTIRTLDPPLHEFLPQEPVQVKALAKSMGISPAKLTAKIESLHELNPMLGHRGCRLGITHPEITRTQARAIFEAACNVAKKSGKQPQPEIMIPLVGTARELELQAAEVRAVAEEVLAARGMKIPYLVGTMIELPRAALVAADIARTAEFFSFGTNDLTQTTFGISRDDSGRFVPDYIEREIFDGDPFARLDREGVGRLMRIACDEGRATRPDIKLGICGEHGGDPASIEFCRSLDLAYVSCSPYRVPIARLAAAQAEIRQRG